MQLALPLCILLLQLLYYDHRAAAMLLSPMSVAAPTHTPPHTPTAPMSISMMDVLVKIGMLQERLAQRDATLQRLLERIAVLEHENRRCWASLESKADNERTEEISLQRGNRSSVEQCYAGQFADDPGRAMSGEEAGRFDRHEADPLRGQADFVSADDSHASNMRNGDAELSCEQQLRELQQAPSFKLKPLRTSSTREAVPQLQDGSPSTSHQKDEQNAAKWGHAVRQSEAIRHARLHEREERLSQEEESDQALATKTEMEALEADAAKVEDAREAALRQRGVRLAKDAVNRTQAEQVAAIETQYAARMERLEPELQLEEDASAATAAGTEAETEREAEAARKIARLEQALRQGSASKDAASARQAEDRAPSTVRLRAPFASDSISLAASSSAKRSHNDNQRCIQQSRDTSTKRRRSEDARSPNDAPMVTNADRNSRDGAALLFDNESDYSDHWSAPKRKRTIEDVPPATMASERLAQPVMSSSTTPTLERARQSVIGPTVEDERFALECTVLKAKKGGVHRPFKSGKAARLGDVSIVVRILLRHGKKVEMSSQTRYIPLDEIGLFLSDADKAKLGRVTMSMRTLCIKSGEISNVIVLKEVVWLTDCNRPFYDLAATRAFFSNHHHALISQGRLSSQSYPGPLSFHHTDNLAPSMHGEYGASPTQSPVQSEVGAHDGPVQSSEVAVHNQPSTLAASDTNSTQRGRLQETVSRQSPVTSAIPTVKVEHV